METNAQGFLAITINFTPRIFPVMRTGTAFAGIDCKGMEAGFVGVLDFSE